MSQIPADLRYTKSHEWMRMLPDGTVEIGITDHAQQSLGDLVIVEVPEAGRKLTAGDACAVVESVKAVADLFAPVTGEVVEVNTGLAEAPDGVNADCYGDGWMLVVQLTDPSEIEQLLSPADYAQHVKDRE